MVKGRFGRYGGQYVSEMLMPALQELEEAFEKVYPTPGFQREYRELLRDYAGRPTPLYYAERFSREIGCRIYLKREDLVYGGSHKLNNTLGQALLAKSMGKRRVITETAAGQHDQLALGRRVATAVVVAAHGADTLPLRAQQGVDQGRLADAG